jgi:hypothetical protein
MKAFGLAFTLWGGTIFLCCGLLFLAGVFTLSGIAIGAFVVFFVALFITCPLLITTTMLIQWALKIPYGATVRLYWLGFMLLIQNYLYFELLAFARIFGFARHGFVLLYFISAPGIVFMLVFKRTALKNFFSQTTNKES